MVDNELYYASIILGEKILTLKSLNFLFYSIICIPCTHFLFLYPCIPLSLYPCILVFSVCIPCTHFLFLYPCIPLSLYPCILVFSVCIHVYMFTSIPVSLYPFYLCIPVFLYSLNPM